MPNITVIIVNYNAGDYLKRCVESLLKQTYRDFEVIIADNGSADHSLDNLPVDERIRIIPYGENLGFAVANNRAAKQASSIWLALLNPDAFPKEDWLEQLVAATKNHPQFSMFGSTQISAEHPELLDGTGDIYHFLGVPLRGSYLHPITDLPETGETFAPCAAAALYRKDIFLSSGGFDEAFFCYCEDVDLAFRLRLMGEKCLQVREAIVYHVGSGISRKTSDFADYHGTRNRFWLFYKNMPLALLLPLLPLHLFLQILFLMQMIKRGQGLVFIRAWKDIISKFPYLVSARRDVQEQRNVTVRELCRSFTYSLKVLYTRGSDVRPL